jgi:hypothetical protein
VYILLMLLRDVCLYFPESIYIPLKTWLPWVAVLADKMTSSSTSMEIWCVIEALFYISLQLHIQWLQKKDPLEASLSAAPMLESSERRLLWDRMMDCEQDDPVSFIQGWFFDSPISNIGRYDILDFWCWCLFDGRNQEHLTLQEVIELEYYVDDFEYRISLHLYGSVTEDDYNDDNVNDENNNEQNNKNAPYGGDDDDDDDDDDNNNDNDHDRDDGLDGDNENLQQGSGSDINKENPDTFQFQVLRDNNDEHSISNSNSLPIRHSQNNNSQPGSPNPRRRRRPRQLSPRKSKSSTSAASRYREDNCSSSTVTSESSSSRSTVRNNLLPKKSKWVLPISCKIGYPQSASATFPVFCCGSYDHDE